MRNSNPDEPAGRRARRQEELSDLDKRIIEHLQEDGRRPFTQIAAALGVSEAAVRARTNRLVERGFLQIVGDDPDDVPIPGERFSFGILKQAQALGDFQALRNHGRRVLRIQTRDVATGLAKIGQAVGATVEVS